AKEGLRIFPNVLNMFSTVVHIASRPVHRGALSRGVVKVGRDGGTRERDQRKATSPGGGAEPSRGTKTAGRSGKTAGRSDKTAGRSDRSVEGVEPELPRGAPNGETHRYSASDPQATGHPGATREDLRVIQVTRRFGAPFPSFGGKKTEETAGEPL